MSDQPSEQDVAEAAAEVAIVAGAIAAAVGTPVYVSEERGPTPVDAMAQKWAERAASAGHTNSREPKVHRALERRGRSHP